jgi:hypothetical protein
VTLAEVVRSVALVNGDLSASELVRSVEFHLDRELSIKEARDAVAYYYVALQERRWKEWEEEGYAD